MRQLGDGSLSRRLPFRADLRSRGGWSRWPAFDFKDASKPNCVIGPSRQPQQVREPLWRRGFCSACLSDGHLGALQASMAFLLSESETFRVIHQYDGPNAAAKGSFRRRSARSSRRRERDWPCKEPRERTQRISQFSLTADLLPPATPALRPSGAVLATTAGAAALRCRFGLCSGYPV
jgi:hypothetical protein